MHKSLSAHFRGCLLGLAVGDALGGPLEFLDAKTIARKHGRVTEMIGGGWLKLSPGQTTDDTQLMLCIGDSLIEKNAFDADDIAARFVAWAHINPTDMDKHSRAVLQRIESGADWKTASYAAQRTSPGSAANGSLMRCAPLALFDWEDASSRIEHSRVQSEITHAHQECQWSCALLNSVLVHAIISGVRDAAIDRALNECRDAPGHIRKRASVVADKNRSELNPTGYVLDTLDCAIWALMNTFSFEDALIEAVNLGGDTDTVGAICGALAGAFYGESEIPQRWLQLLQDRDRIATLADKLAARHGF